MQRFVNKLLLSLALTTVLLGCVGNGAVPEQRFYRLPELQPAPVAGPIITEPLGIPRLQASGLYHERAILHFLPERPLDLRPYHYHHWSDSPTLLIRDHLASYLQATGAATGIVRYQDEGRAKQRLYGQLIRFEREVAPERIVVHVTLEFSLEAGRSITFPPKRYQAQQEASDRTMHSTVQAFSVALESIYRRLLDDLRATAR